MHPIDSEPPSGADKIKDRFFHLLQASLRLILAGVAARGAAIAVLNPSQAQAATNGAHE